MRVQISPSLEVRERRSFMRGTRLLRGTILFVFFLLLSAELLPDPWAIEAIIGKRGPYFSLMGRDGREHSIVDFEGNVVVLNFWASWCPPCRKEIPALERLQKDYREKRLKVITISTDSRKADLDAFLKKYPVHLPVLHDSKLKVWRKYRVFSLPTTFLIDRRGVVVERFLGGHDWASPEMKSRINELLE